jgi:hypothetical protein
MTRCSACARPVPASLPSPPWRRHAALTWRYAPAHAAAKRLSPGVAHLTPGSAARRAPREMCDEMTPVLPPPNRLRTCIMSCGEGPPPFFAAAVFREQWSARASPACPPAPAVCASVTTRLRVVEVARGAAAAATGRRPACATLLWLRRGALDRALGRVDERFASPRAAARCRRAVALQGPRRSTPVCIHVAQVRGPRACDPPRSATARARRRVSWVCVVTSGAARMLAARARACASVNKGPRLRLGLARPPGCGQAGVARVRGKRAGAGFSRRTGRSPPTPPRR